MARTLLLDLDGTLVDTVPDLAAALNRLMRARGLPDFSSEQVAAMVGDGVAVLVARAFAAMDRQPDAAAVAEMSADYAAHVAVESKLYPDVLPVLSGLAGQGWRLAVCTNKPEQAARALLQALGLLPLLCAVGGGDSFPVAQARSGASAGDAGAGRRAGRCGGDAGRSSQRRAWRREAPGYRASSPPGDMGRSGWRTVALRSRSDIAEAAAIANRLLPDTVPNGRRRHSRPSGRSAATVTFA